MQKDHWYKRYNSPEATGILQLAALITHKLIAERISTDAERMSEKLDIQKKNQFGIPLRLHDAA